MKNLAVLLGLAAAAVTAHAAGSAATEQQVLSSAERSHTKPYLRGAGVYNASHGLLQHAKSTAPCHCDPMNPSWNKCTRTVPKCVFIDLGAADGNTFNTFINNGFGPVDRCPSVQWEAILVEANPRFNDALTKIGEKHQGSVSVLSSTAAYMCEGKTSFYLDTTNTKENYWGSSLSSNHPDVQKSGMKRVEVQMMNLNRVLYEHTIPGDWVMVKMDIEGAEFDVVPCLAQSPVASLIDRLYLEQHDPSWGMEGTTMTGMEEAKSGLKTRGVDIPPYFSPTL